ncbi:MAG: HAMP domain-containing sensor histidine kinase [Chloroflexota bacterium]
MTVSDERKTKEQLLSELVTLRQRVAKLESLEQGQRQQEELLQIFRLNSPVGVFIIQDGKFQFVNDEFRQVTGAKEGENTMKLVYPADRELVRENAINMLKGERLSPYKYRLIDQEGQVRWMLEVVVPIQYRGRRAVMGHSMDITERERAEAKLRELYEQERELRQQLEAEAKRRIEFTRSLVHELKTPLTPVLASSDLLVSELHEEPWLSIAKNIHRGANNLNKRIDELLDIARSEIGMLQVHPKTLDPLPLLRGIAEDMSAMIANNGQTLVCALEPILPPVWADEERLRQVVLNLMINASKFTPEGGQITLKAGTRDNELVVEVQDTGHGIPRGEQQYLFQPYYRQRSDREHVSGLGLGLALCKTLIELHHGKIWVKSEVGQGSTFGFSIPLATAEQQEEAR